MKSRKRAMRRFKKKNIIGPLLVFVLGLILLTFLSIIIIAAEIAGVFQEKVVSAKQLANVQMEALLDDLDEYDNDMEALLDDSNLEIAIMQGEEVVYCNTDQYTNQTFMRMLVDANDESMIIFFSEQELDDIQKNSKGVLIADTEEHQIVFSTSGAWDLYNARMKNYDSKQGIFNSSVWVLTDSVCDDGNLVIHSPIIITFADIKLSIIVIVVTGILFVIIVLILFINIIASVINSNKMLKALYFDDKTLTNNWLYLTTKAEKMIANKAGSYAIIAVKCGKYDHCKSCSGAANADNILLQTFNELKKVISKRDLIARNSDANIGIVIKRKNVEALIQTIENIANGCKETVCVGAYILTPENRGWNNMGVKEIVEDYYHYAKVACDSIKDGDTTKIAYFDLKLREEHMWIHTVESRMESALANEEFVVYIQPKYDPKEAKLKGAEALIRWNSKEYGLILPSRFIPIFEENGSITKIDDYMLAHVAKLQSDWINEGFDVVPVSVNISRVHFMDPMLAEHICEIVDAYGTPHEVIEIELTESAFFDDKKALLNTVSKLQQYGFQVSMDDFGSGYSSLNSLKDLALDVLKLDADFFRGESNDNRGELIVGKAIELAKALNMDIVAEGVEQKEQVDFLADAGCDMIQGFYFDKPMPVDEYENRMKGNTAEQ